MLIQTRKRSKVFFQNGIEYLRSKLLTNAGTTATVSRGAETLLDSIPVVLARSEFEDIGENGRRYTVYLTDVLISGALNYRPAKGDKITINGAVYIVRPMGKELYRFDDPYKTLVRVHTQLETGSL